MTSLPTRQFDMRVEYLPADTGLFFWENFHRDGVAEDFERASSLRYSRLSVPLWWHDFQPDERRVSVDALRRLELLLRLASDYGLTAILTLLPLEIAGLVCVPSWALALEGRSTRRVLAGHHLTFRAVRNVFVDERVVQAQARLVREAVGAFGDHPAVDGWTLGDRVSTIARPPSRTHFERWLATLADAARSSARSPRLWHAISARDLVLVGACDPSVAGELGIGMRIVDDWRPSWASDAGIWWSAFLAAYAGRLSASPAVVSAVGLCTTSNAVPAPLECVDESTAARFLERLLPLLHEVGGAGCEAALIDPHNSLARKPPYDQNPAALTRGLLHADGTPKESSRVWQEFTGDGRTSIPIPEHVPSIDPEVRVRQPETVARDWFQTLAG